MKWKVFKYFAFVALSLFTLLYSCGDIESIDQPINNPVFMPSVNDDGNTIPLARCESGFADIYPCNGYDLISHIPITTLASNILINSTTPSGNDIWGWTDPINNKEYAIVGTSNSTAFVDITNPTAPVFLGKINTQTVDNSWRDIKVYNNHAFIVADNTGAHGMQVFDLTRLRDVATPPQTFNPDFVYSNIESCHNIFINETSGIAYLIGCNTANGGPVFLDISIPTNPIELGNYEESGYTHDAQVVTYNGPDTDHIGKEIFVGSNGDSRGTNTIVIVDVTDKSNPQLISEIDYPNPGYTHQGWFTENLSYFILGDELDEIKFGGPTRSLIFNFTDLDNPVLSSTYLGNTQAIDHNGYVKGNFYYLANYTAGLRVLDIKNIAASTNAMEEVGFFDTYPSNNSVSYNGVWSVYPYFNSGNIIINDINNGLFIVRKSN